MKRTVYVDLDGVLADYKKAFNEKLQPGLIEYPQSQLRFFENLDLIPDAKVSIEVINDWFDLWILTSPSVMNPNSWTEKAIWVEENFGHLGLHKKTIMAPDKSRVVNSGEFLIDDNVWDIKGELILFGGKDYPNWLSVCSYLYGKTCN